MFASTLNTTHKRPLRGPAKRILVTGGAGFLGSYLCERFLLQGHEVLCLDNLYAGSKQNIQHLQSSPLFEFIRHDVTVPLALEVDEIYNMACPASPRHYRTDPVKTTETIVLGTINMLNLAKNTGAKILQASAGEVYGDPVVYPQHESYWGNVDPLGPTSCYEEGKRCAESLCMNYRNQYGVNTKIVRLFNTLGPGMHPGDGRVVSSFIVQALLGQDITLYGDGSQTRSFCDVDDLIEGIARAMSSENDFMGPVNLGNPNEVTLIQLVEMILQKTRSVSRVVYKPLPAHEPVQRCPDIYVAREKLGWEPCISLDTSLNRTISYFRTWISSDVTDLAA